MTEEVGVYFNCKKSLIPFYLDAIPEATLTGTTTLGKAARQSISSTGSALNRPE